MNWYHRKVEESKLWDYTNAEDIEVLERIGFVGVEQDGRVFFTNPSPVTLKKSSTCSSKF